MWTFLLGGLATTVQLLGGSLLVGLTLGLVVAVTRLSQCRVLRWLAGAYIEAMRGIPLLVLLLFLYFGLQSVIGEAWRIEAFWAAVSAFGLCYGAYFAEVFRAGVQSVDVGQTEAARALGLTSAQTLRHIVLPQAIRNILPALVNESVALLKDTSLASVIAIPEMTQRARLEVARTYETFRVWGAVALIYLVLTLGLSWVARRWERGERYARTHDMRSASL